MASPCTHRSKCKSSYHVHDTAYTMYTWAVYIHVAVYTPTAILDQLTPFWPGSLWTPIIKIWTDSKDKKEEKERTEVKWAKILVQNRQISICCPNRMSPDQPTNLLRPTARCIGLLYYGTCHHRCLYETNANSRNRDNVLQRWYHWRYRTETSEPSVTARSECNYSGVCKSEQEGKKLIETGEKNPCIWAYVLIENNKKLFSLER